MFVEHAQKGLDQEMVIFLQDRSKTMGEVPLISDYIIVS